MDAAVSWRRHVWKKARKELLPRLPLEVVRRRVRRATELGLEYPQYASILLGTGRDIVGFLFTCDALGLRLERDGHLPDGVRAKLGRLIRVDRMIGAEAPSDPAPIATALTHQYGLEIAAAVALPAPGAPWAAGRDAIRAALAPLKMPSDTVVMVGAQPHQRAWSDAAQLAKFVPAEQYFGG